MGRSRGVYVRFGTEALTSLAEGGRSLLFLVHFDGPGFVWLRHRKMNKTSLKSRSNENHSVTREQKTEANNVLSAA